MINKGSTDGVKEGLPVISPEGVVGRVIECSWNYSKILLVTDYNSNIDALVQGSRAQGILQGGGHRLLRLKYVQRTEEVKAGENGHHLGARGGIPEGTPAGDGRPCRQERPRAVPDHRGGHVGGLLENRRGSGPAIGERIKKVLGIGYRVQGFRGLILPSTLDPRSSTPILDPAPWHTTSLFPSSRSCSSFSRERCWICLFGGRIGVEVSLILVIYAGFHLDMVKGGVLAFLAGFLLDCVSGTIMGLYTFTYVLIFIFSYLLSPRIYGERMLFIMGYAFLCVLLEGLFIFAVYWSIYGTDVSQGLIRTYLPQALVAGVLSPAIFALFNRLEVYVHAGEAR